MKGSRLSLDLFKVYSDLAATGSFSKAASLNHLSQSAVSHQIAFLERNFGQRLVERGGRKGCVLTEKGREFLESSGKILEIYRAAVEKANSSAELSGSLRIETIYSIGLYDLPPIIRSFIHHHPKVSLEVDYNKSSRIYADVLEGRCDLGIVACPHPNPYLIQVPLHKTRMVLACLKNDPLIAHKRSLSLKDIRGRAFVAFHKDIPTRKAVDAFLNKHAVSVKIAQEFDNIETIKRAVEVGVGISILPENTLIQESRHRILASRAFVEGPFYRPTAILFKKDYVISRAAREFIRWPAKVMRFPVKSLPR
ncbi:MAG: LysR family transcriptional regulator [Elusimicrobiota bacterium]